MAKPAKKTRSGAGKGKPETLSAPKRVLALFIAIILVVLFFDSVILMAAGMIPTGVAYLIDRGPRKHAMRTVAWTNLAGCLVVVLDLWTGGGSIDRAIELLTDPFNWVIMFGSAGFGWVIYFTLPPIVAGYLTLSQEMKLKELAKVQKTLEKEWGKDVRKNAPLDRLEAVEEEIAEAERRARKTSRGAGAGTENAPRAASGTETAAEDEMEDEDLTDTPAGRPIAGRYAGASKSAAARETADEDAEEPARAG